jgi:UDP-2,3-diacylglucosamine hydrolase
MKTRRNLQILISDLHVDRWDRERKERFFDFVDFVEKNAQALYVLGDIFDFPPLKGETVWPRHKLLITRLLDLPKKGIPLVYLIGNHDISLRGIELYEKDFTITYCDAKRPLEREIFGKKAYMDHGHFYDPLFQDHLYEAAEFLRSVTGKAVDQSAVDFWRDVVRIFQRNPKDKPTVKTHDRQQIGVPERFLKIWEQAAEQLLKRMRYDVVFFGHTHAPNIIETEAKNQWYVNTGDWLTHSTYVEFTDTGISLKDWLSGTLLKEITFSVQQ